MMSGAPAITTTEWNVMQKELASLRARVSNLEDAARKSPHGLPVGYVPRPNEAPRFA